MLSEVYKDKLAVTVNKMVEIRIKNPNTYKTDHEWQKLKEESEHLEAQIRTCERITGAPQYVSAEPTKKDLTTQINTIQNGNTDKMP